MKKLIWLLLITPAFAQYGNKPNTITLTASGAPTGGCAYNFQYLDSASGIQYNCKAGAWNAIGGSGSAGTVTSIATTSPIGGGTITGTGTLTCTTCVVASSPGAGIAHFAGSTQTVTSSAIVNADITAATIDLTSKVTGALPVANGGTGASTLTVHGVVLGNTTSAVNVTAAGTSGQVLTSNGASADPTFQAAAGGAMVQLETHAASSSASLAFTTCFSSTYHNYIIKFNDVVPATNAVNMTLTFNSDSSAIYDYFTLRFNSGGSAAGGATNATAARINAADATLSNDAHYGMNGTWRLSDPNSTTSYKHLTWQTTNAGNDSVLGQATYKSTTAVTRFDVQMSSGNIASGTVTCYGVTP